MWDHSGEEHQSSRGRLQIMPFYLNDGTPAAVGVRVVAIGVSQAARPNYRVGHTGVITRVSSNDPIVMWDHSGEERQSSRGRLQIMPFYLNDGTPAAVGVRVVAVGASQAARPSYRVGHTGVITRVSSNDPIVMWDHSGEERQSSRGRLRLVS
jgi:hypothetical protein